MAALAIGLVWVAYYGGLYGYCLLRGYEVTPKGMLSPDWGSSPTSGPLAGLGKIW